jgi:hypothetical protein
MNPDPQISHNDSILIYYEGLKPIGRGDSFIPGINAKAIQLPGHELPGYELPGHL